MKVPIILVTDDDLKRLKRYSKLKCSIEAMVEMPPTPVTDPVIIIKVSPKKVLDWMKVPREVRVNDRLQEGPSPRQES